jgi:hypothetical protein
MRRHLHTQRQRGEANMRRITVVLPKDVATAAKMMAVQRDVPLRAVVELALRRLLGMPAEKEGGEK